MAKNKVARKTLGEHCNELRLAGEVEAAIKEALRFPKARPDGAFQSFQEADVARRRANTIAGRRSRYVTNEGGWWAIQEHGRLPDRVHRPGTLHGALRPRGMAAAWTIWCETKITPFWSAEQQERHRMSAYSGTVAAGIVWC